MQDEIIIKTPAKINLFLRVFNKRMDGYHNIFSAITFIDLYDEIKIKLSNLTDITYLGPFKPDKGTYEDCIIKKTLKKFINNDKINLSISVIKNIPVQGGLGSASTNAAGIIKGLDKLNIIDLKKLNNFSYGADITPFLFGKNCIVNGIGNNVLPCDHPRYFFLIVKPKLNLSTKKMYSDLNRNVYSNIELQEFDSKIVETKYFKNDFEEFAEKKYVEIKKIMQFLRNIDNLNFAHMTGSGSCCFAAFNNKDIAIKAQKKFTEKFPDLWSCIAENNTIN